jgi:hypothetical protein
MNTRRTLKYSSLCPIQRFKHKTRRNGAEEIFYKKLGGVHHGFSY